VPDRPDAAVLRATVSRVAELLFFPDADRQLSALEADSARRQLYDQVNDMLDVLEIDPGDASVWRLRYQTPPIWGTPVYGSGGEWIILWSESESGTLVHYVGEAPR